MQVWLFVLCTIRIIKFFILLSPLCLVWIKVLMLSVIKLGCICMRCCCGMNEVRKSSISNVRLGSEYTPALSKGLLKRKNTNSFNITQRHFRDTVSKNPNVSWKNASIRLEKKKKEMQVYFPAKYQGCCLFPLYLKRQTPRKILKYHPIPDVEFFW